MQLSPLTLLAAWGAGPLQALSAHLPADNSAQAQHTEEILKQLRQMQEQVSPFCLHATLMFQYGHPFPGNKLLWAALRGRGRLLL